MSIPLRWEPRDRCEVDEKGVIESGVVESVLELGTSHYLTIRLTDGRTVGRPSREVRLALSQAKAQP